MRRAEIDEEAWASLYSTVSRPFPWPPTSKIAVKVINLYGDEVLKVFAVSLAPYGMPKSVLIFASVGASIALTEDIRENLKVLGFGG